MQQNFVALTEASTTTEEEAAAIAIAERAQQGDRYALHVEKADTGEQISVGALRSASDEKLKVTLKPEGSSRQYIWTPLDNDNIFILMRE